jgi:hypothetical protein
VTKYTERVHNIDKYDPVVILNERISANRVSGKSNNSYNMSLHA